VCVREELLHLYVVDHPSFQLPLRHEQSLAYLDPNPTGHAPGTKETALLQCGAISCTTHRKRDQCSLEDWYNFSRRTNDLQATLANRATVGSHKEAAMMTPDTMAPMEIEEDLASLRKPCARKTLFEA
jgi:hypothetical protein